MSHSSAAARLACHGEDADHKVDAPVAQKRHLRLVPVALFGFFLGLDGCPDADPEDQQVEEDHDGHSGNVQSHDGAAVVRMKSASSSLDGAACLCLRAERERAQRRRLELHAVEAHVRGAPMEAHFHQRDQKTTHYLKNSDLKTFAIIQKKNQKKPPKNSLPVKLLKTSLFFLHIPRILQGN